MRQSGVHVFISCLIIICYDSNVGLFLLYPFHYFSPSTDASCISSVVETVLMTFNVSTIVPVNAFVRDLLCVVDKIPAAPCDDMTGNAVQTVA